MSDFKIEKNIPVPARVGRKKYPFDEMEVGDSVLFENTGIGDAPVTAARSWFKTHERKCTAAKDGNAVRVWRTE